LRIEIGEDLIPFLLNFVLVDEIVERAAIVVEFYLAERFLAHVVINNRNYS
jgi:hypothetical protein